MNPASWSPSERKQKWGREPMLELRCLNVYISGCQFLFLGLQSDVHACRRWPSGASHGYEAYNKSKLETTWLWLARSLQSIVFRSMWLSFWRQFCFTLVSDCKQKENYCGSQLYEIAYGFCLSIASQHPVKQFQILLLMLKKPGPIIVLCSDTKWCPYIIQIFIVNLMCCSCFSWGGVAYAWWRSGSLALTQGRVTDLTRCWNTCIWQIWPVVGLAICSTIFSELGWFSPSQ